MYDHRRYREDNDNTPGKIAAKAAVAKHAPIDVIIAGTGMAASIALLIYALLSVGTPY
jgi:phosphoribosylcarboxyaminoimidazole (NCAIR) mutase